MNRERQRKLDARARRQESMNSRYNPTAEKTIIQVPQPKELKKEEVIKVASKVSAKVAPSKKSVKNNLKVPEKRGPGRPPKSVASKNLKGIKKTSRGKEKKYA
jgi:hypothetical protein